MELGNMIVGNSRGEYEVPRDETFEGPWERLCETLKIGYRGGPEDGCVVPETPDWFGVENHVFRIRTYDWDAECDCGVEDKMDRWFAANPHSPDCYQTEYHARLKSWEDHSGYTRAYDLAFGRNDDGAFPGMNAEIERPMAGVTVGIWTPRTDAAMEAYRKLSDRRRKIEAALFDKLCAKHGTDRQYGAAVHCTCGRDKRGDLFWQNIGGHKDECRFVQPNFLYKPTGFRLNWYKYPFRDSYMNQPLSGGEWSMIIDACIASAQSSQTPTSQGDAEGGVLGNSGINPKDPAVTNEAPNDR
jgi:hypothetical protein